MSRDSKRILKIANKVKDDYNAHARKVGRVDECAALEMRYAGNGIGGSNPPPSAKIEKIAQALGVSSDELLK